MTMIQPRIDVSPSTLGDYAERVLNFNVNSLRKSQKRTQKSLIEPMGVTSEGAVSQRLNGLTHWSLVSAVNVAHSLGTTLDSLLDDTKMKEEIAKQADLLRVQLEQMNHMSSVNTELTKNPRRHAVGNDGELLRLGLNQRPSD